MRITIRPIKRTALTLFVLLRVLVVQRQSCWKVWRTGRGISLQCESLLDDMCDSLVADIECEYSLPTNPVDHVKRALSLFGLSGEQEVGMDV